MSKKSNMKQLYPKPSEMVRLVGDSHVDKTDATSKSKYWWFDRMVERGHFEVEWVNGKRMYIFREEKSVDSKDAPNKSSVDQTPSSLINAEFILHLFLKPDELDAVIGDLFEKYARKCERFGPRRAKFWFYSEVLRSLWPLLKRFVTKAGGLLALGEWIRRHVS